MSFMKHLAVSNKAFSDLMSLCKHGFEKPVNFEPCLAAIFFRTALCDSRGAMK